MTNNYMNAKQFKIWVTDNYNSYLQFERTNENVKCYSYPQTGTTIIINTSSLKVARSKCTYPDSFDTYTGVAIAWARYQNKTIPTVVKRITMLKDVEIGQDIIMVDPRTSLEGTSFKMLGGFANNFQDFCIMRKGDNALFSIKGAYKVGIL